MEKITVEIVVRVSCQETWRLFTTPEHIMQWNHASPDWHCPQAINDLRVGGSFNYRMESVDGTQGFDFEGEYTEVSQGNSFSYRMSDGREVRVSFQDAHGGTRVVEVFDPEQENPIELQRAGWQSILDQFKEYVER